MMFSEIKRQTLLPQKERRAGTFFLALCVAAALFLPYMFLSEGYFTFFGDFNVQQIPFYKMCHAAIKSGNVRWNWQTDLGANFVGSYSFYLLGSPFFWLTLPFPNRMVPYLMGPLLMLKFAFAALTSYCYFRRFTKTPAAAQLGALLYAFSGFSVYNIFFNHFHEPLIFFPLLLLALELLLTENRRGVFTLAAAVCAVSNYFFFFGMVVFTVIYFFVRLCSGTWGFRFPRFLALLFEAVLGVLLSAFLLLPACLAILGNGRISEILLGWSAFLYGKEQIYANVLQCFFFPPDLPARPVFFPEANVKWSSLGGWLPLFSTTGLFVLFFEKKKSWLKRIIGICIFMALVPILNSLFYALNVAYYARWFYMPILMMVLATVMLTEDRSVHWWRGWRWVFFITLAVSLVIGFFPQKNADGGLIFGLYTQGEDLTYPLRFWASCLIALISLVILALLIPLLQKDRTAFYRAATVCVCLVSVLYGNVFIATGRTHSYEVKDVMIDQLIEGKVNLEKGNYRIDVYDGVDNTGMYLGYPTINAFHSIVPASVMEFYGYVGEKRSVASRPSTENEALRPLLSVKYLLNRTDGESFIDEDGTPAMSGYNYTKTSGGYYVYENENFIPYGFSYDYYMTKEFCDGYDEEDRAALMLKAVLLSKEQIKKYGKNMTDLAAPEELEETVTERTDGEPTVRTQENMTEKEDTPTLSLNREAMAKDAARLKATAADRFKIDNYGFSATVSRKKETLLFFSVPYDEGWTATVNGKSVPIEKVNVGFMAVQVPSGRSTVTFSYKTPGLETGIYLSLGAAFVFVIYLLSTTLYRQSHRDYTLYPEGERLLHLWQADDMLPPDFGDEDTDEPSRPSILDDTPIIIPPIYDGVSGGFTIDESAFDEDENS